VCLVAGKEGLYRAGTMVGKYVSMLVLVALGGSLFGCSGADEREQCERMCEFLEECSEMACPDDGIDNCVENVKNASDDCQSAIEEFTDCWDEHPQCDALTSECLDSALDFATECDGEFGV
jgi:hypothetical protein